MSKIQNLGGFITIPIPSPDKFQTPMTFFNYKLAYGFDLMDILTDSPADASVPVFKTNKPLLTQDADKYMDNAIPLICPLVSNITEVEGVEMLQFIHGYFPDKGFYMRIDWANKLLRGGEY